MVVDDAKTDRVACVEALRPGGHVFIETSDGEQCLQEVRRSKPDMIILDVVMPEKNGFQVCRELKKDSAYQDIPVIMLTSKSQEADKSWGVKQGANAYLTKPLNADELRAAVSRLLR